MVVVMAVITIITVACMRMAVEVVDMRQFIVSAVSWQQSLRTCHRRHEGEGGGGKGGGGGGTHYRCACVSARCGGQCERKVVKR